MHYIVQYSLQMKMLLTVIIVLVLSTNRLVVADDQCTQYQFKAPFYPGNSCEDIYNMNPESRDKSGYYWILNGPSYVYCGMNYNYPVKISIIIILKLVTKMDIILLIIHSGPFVT